MMESDGYWRLMLTQGWTDKSTQLGGYGEYTLNSHISAFVLGVLPVGNAQQEFSSLMRYSVTAGIKIALP